MKIQYNPTGLVQVSREHIEAAMGFIPQFLFGRFGGEDTLRSRLETGYAQLAGAQCRWDNEGMVDKATGSYEYPEDPILHPLAKFTRLSDTVFIYEYGFVSIFDDQTPDGEICRMD